MKNSMTAEEFERRYAERSGMTVKRLRALGRVVRPCFCGEYGCEGWKSVDRETATEGMTPAEYLRTLERQATPGEWDEKRVLLCLKRIATWDESYLEQDVRLIVALRTLLPTLADVVEAAKEARDKFGGISMEWERDKAWKALDVNCDRLAAAVAAVEGTK